MDRLLLSRLQDWAADRYRPADLHDAADGTGRPGASIVVLDDVGGALTLGVAEFLVTSGATAPGQGAIRVRAACDSRRSFEALRAVLDDASPAVAGTVDPAATPEDAVQAGTLLVLARLPKGLDALDELAGIVASQADPQAVVVVAARDKFLSRGLNQVLGRHFTSVRASLGQQKCRALIADSPIRARPAVAAPNASVNATSTAPAPPPYPRRHRHADLGLVVCAHGAAFAGTSVDRGTRLLLNCLDRVEPTPSSPGEPLRVVDLGCGTGLLAAYAARRFPSATVLAVDDARSAVRSAEATALANDVADRVAVQWADGLAAAHRSTADSPAPAYDLVLCNPPFHRGTTKDSDTAFAMIADAGALLRPGGELWLVYNAHLPYLPALRRQVGTTTIETRDRDYLVTRSRRRASTA